MSDGISSIKKCPTCGKRITVLYPHQWAYKRRKDNSVLYHYFCSWSCLRAWDDKKGRGDMRISKEQKQTVIDMAMRGESPVKYIESCGINNPSCTWWNIKKNLSKHSPEIYAKLPDKFKSVPRQVETPEGEFAPATVKVDGPLRIETPEPEKVEIVPAEQKITAPLCYDGCKVTAVETPIGDFHYDKKHGYIDWDFENDTMSLTLGQWRMFAEWFPKAQRVLGVEL